MRLVLLLSIVAQCCIGKHAPDTIFDGGSSRPEGGYRSIEENKAFFAKRANGPHGGAKGTHKAGQPSSSKLRGSRSSKDRRKKAAKQFHKHAKADDD